MNKWTTKKISSIGEESRITFEPQNNIEKPYIGLEHIGQQTLHLTSIGSSKDTISSKKVFSANDVLFGTLRPYFRKVVKPRFDGVCSSDITVLKAKEGNSQDYLFYLVASQPIIDFASVSANGTKMPRAKWSVIGKELFKIPPLPIQRKIAAILTAYDDLIENNNKRISILENMAEQIYKEWFVRMRFPGYKNTKFVKGIPEGWKIVPISSAYSTSSGGTPARGINKYYGGDIPWIKTGELHDTFIMNTAESITRDGLNNSSAKLFPKHSVILALYGATIGQVGITTCESATNQACCVLLPKYDYISYEFTFQLIRTLKQYFFLVAFGGAQQNISQDVVKKTQITIPPKQLIIDYIEKVKDIYLQIQNLHLQQTLVKKTRDLLLPRLLSGKLSVENLDIKFPPSMENENA